MNAATVSTVGDGQIAVLAFASDLLLITSYVALLLALVWFVLRRPEVFRAHQGLAYFLGAFILLIIAARAADAISRWLPLQTAEGWFRLAAAAAFAALIATVVPLLKDVARLPSPRELRDINERLQCDMAARESKLAELETACRALEGRLMERNRDLGLATARFKAALCGAKVYISSQDRDLRYIAVTDSILGVSAENLIGRTDQEVLPAGVREEVVALKRRAIDGSPALDREINIPDESTPRWYDFHVEPLRDASGEVIGVTTAAVDITARRQAEAHLRLLLRELTHRSKNLLAVVQAMARQTARHSDSIEAFLDQFGSRLHAVASSHDLLVQEGWRGVSVTELVRCQLGPYLDSAHPQILLRGDGVLLEPEVAQNLGLALHELAANAVRFGALSAPKGRVSVAWSPVPRGGNTALEILWEESGGPEVEPPRRRGFGTLVIQENLPRSVDAEVDLAFPAQGVRCRIVIPPARLLSQETRTQT
jgi:PAS domain S-box-containing protein